MDMPSGVRFLKSHEWARKDGDSIVVGISDFAVDQLNKEIVYVELPDPGRKVKQGDSFGVIESVKAASDLYAPVTGTVVESNPNLAENPALIAEDPYGAGWMIKIEPSNDSEFDSLLSPEDYRKQTESEEAH
jgi:glycine cleavage system H protein